MFPVSMGYCGCNCSLKYQLSVVIMVVVVASHQQIASDCVQAPQRYPQPAKCVFIVSAHCV